MTGEMIILVLVLGSVGWAYVHLAGKAFDRKYGEASAVKKSKKRHSG